MTDIFSVIEGLTVEKEEILEAERFAEQYLSTSFPTYDFRQGTGLRDMTVRPNALLLALINKATKHYFDDMDVINFTDETDRDVVDRRLSNFFIDRRSGSSAKIRSRLYFSFPRDQPAAVQIPVSAYFSVDDINKFSPQSTISVLAPTDTPIPGNFYLQLDTSQSLWYVDIDLVGGEYEEFNISEGDLLYFTIFSPYFVKGEVLYLVQQAVTEESNSEMVKRASTSISTRNMINEPSIESRLRSVFGYINDVYTVGLGNPNLYRDIIKVPDINTPEIIHEYHRGGHVDILVDTAIITQTVQLFADDQGKMRVSGPVVAIRRSATPPPGRMDDTIPFAADMTYNIIGSTTYDSDSVPLDTDLDKGLSPKQVTEISMIARAGDTATFEIDVYQGLTRIQNWIDDVENRVVTADYLARAFEPIYIDVGVKTYGEVPDDLEGITAEVRRYIEGIPNGGTLFVSPIIEAISEAGVKDFQLPLGVSSQRIPKDLAVQPVVPVVDKLESTNIRKFKLRTLTVEKVA